MKKKKWSKVLSVFLVMVTAVSLLSGCGGKSAEKEDAETITVYLWSTNLYEKYAPYIQEQLPDINVEFVVGNNDLDFYKFLDENGGLPDIITCCRFSLHDASPLKDSLMDLSTTNAAGAVYDTYLSNFRNEDGSVNWLPVCADAHGFVVNKDLFEKYDIPLPTDYESFVSACQAFNSQLLEEETASEDIVLDSQKSYSNRFHSSGGNAAYSVMANTLRGIYGSDVLIATGNSFTGNVLKAGYTEKMAGDMIMPNGLAAYSSKMSGAELKEIIKNFVEGYEGGFIPFNRGSLPVVSGISVEINETEDGYTLSKVTKDGKAVRDEDTFTVTCLATPQHMETYPVDENMIFDGGATSVKDTWTAYVSGGNAVLAEPEDYITLR